MSRAAATRPSLGIGGTIPPVSAPEGETILQRRHRLRRRAGRIAGRLTATARCGRASLSASGGVDVWRGDRGSAAIKGVATCGSIWACPVCAAKIAFRRSEELSALLAKHGAAGGSAALLTLTARHNRRQALADVRGAVLAAWARLTGSGWWRRTVRDDYRLAGYIRAVEITHGANGWHPHIHALLCFDGPQMAPGRLTRLRRLIFRQWAILLRGDKVNRRGRRVEIGAGPLPSYRHGVDLVAASCTSGTVARYVAKWGAGQELSGHGAKQGRGGNRTPFQLLQAADTGDRHAAALYRHYVLVTKGTRHLGVSPELRRRYRWQVQADEVAAARQPDIPGLAGEGELVGKVGALDGQSWKAVVARHLIAPFLEAVSAGGFDAGVSYLAGHGIFVSGWHVAEWYRLGKPQPSARTDRDEKETIADHRWRAVTHASPDDRAALRASVIANWEGTPA